MSETLYETDLHAWARAQAAALRRAGAARVNADVDWEHVAEEIEALGRHELAAAESLLQTIILHLLKLKWSPAEPPRRDWHREVTAFRLALATRVRRAPSLRARIDLEAVYADARTLALLRLEDDGIAPDVPAACPYTLDQLADRDWWPERRDS